MLMTSCFMVKKKHDAIKKTHMLVPTVYISPLSCKIVSQKMIRKCKKYI